MRAVAAEAGVSLRLVQYYFTTKQALVLDALARLGSQLQARMDRWVREAGSPPQPRSTVTAILSSVLPTDEESRRITRIYAAYYVLVLGDSSLEEHATPNPPCWKASSPSSSAWRRRPALSAPRGIPPWWRPD